MRSVEKLGVGDDDGWDDSGRWTAVMDEVMWEQLRYDIERAFDAQWGLLDAAWALTNDLSLCE